MLLGVGLGLGFWFFFWICISGWLCLCHWTSNISLSVPLHIFTWLLERIVAFSCSCCAWPGSLCWFHLQGRGTREQQGPAQTRCCSRGPSGQEAALPVGTQHAFSMWWDWMVQLFSFCFSCISRNIKEIVIKKKNQNCSRWRAACKIQTPKARLKALARLSGINSKMSAFFLLDRFVTFPFLSLLYITCSTGIAYCGKNSYLQMLTGDLAAAERSCLKQPGVVPDFPLCLHSPQHGTGQGEWVSGCWGITQRHGFTATPGLAVISALAQRNCISRKCSHPLQGLSPTKSHKSCSVNMTLCSVRWWGAMISQGIAKP